MKPRGSNRERSFGKPQQKPFRRASDADDKPKRERRDEARSERPRRDAREQRRDRPGAPPSPFGGVRNRDRAPEYRGRRAEGATGTERPGRDDRRRPGRDSRNRDERQSRPERRDFRTERTARDRGEQQNRRDKREPRRERPQFGPKRDDRFSAQRADRAHGSGDRDRARDERRPGPTDRRSKFQRPERPKFRDTQPDIERRVPHPLPSGEGTIGAVVVSRRGAQRLRGGNPWVYRSDIISTNGINPGAAVPVVDDRGKALGTALYSSSSQIAIRMISIEPIGSAENLLHLVRERVKNAIAYRDKVVSDSDACRVIFSEADLLPGLIVDRYNDVLSLQVLTQAMDREDIRAAVLDELVQHYQPAGVLERVEPRIRELEKLPPRESALLHGEKSSTTFTMNGLKFAYDGLAGQKTGAFLDQRENYAAAARYAHGEAIDVFCYQGGFALHLARVCDQVTGVDVSRPALEIAEQNAAANSDALGGREIEWIEANAFDLLRDYSDAGQQYDTIVLDPPAFAKSHKNLETALRGYKELNLRALKMLRPGGVLVTCSCSFHVSEFEFMQMLAEAAADAHRTLRIVEKRTQAKDHPVLLSHPESQYLKCIIAIAD